MNFSILKSAVFICTFIKIRTVVIFEFICYHHSELWHLDPSPTRAIYSFKENTSVVWILFEKTHTFVSLVVKIFFNLLAPIGFCPNSRHHFVLFWRVTVTDLSFDHSQFQTHVCTSRNEVENIIGPWTVVNYSIDVGPRSPTLIKSEKFQKSFISHGKLWFII